MYRLKGCESSEGAKIVYKGGRIPGITFVLLSYDSAGGIDEGEEISQNLSKNIWRRDGIALISDPK